MKTVAQPAAGGFALRMRDVSVTLGDVPVLKNVSFEPAVGKLNAIIGPNGAGKTTLLRAILGLVPYTGRIEIGTDPQGRPLRLAYVPQRLDFDQGCPLSVYDLLCCGLQRTPIWLGPRRRSRRQADEALARVGGAGWGRQRLGALSGGELQRVLLALALTSEPDILLLDEPVAGVDVAGEELFCDLLGSLQTQGRYTMLLVSHDLSIVHQHAQYVLCLSQTARCQGDTVTTLTAENLRTLYGHDVGLYGHTGEHEGHAHDPSHAHDHRHLH
ncbi:MAG: metal ABC transporter ATP-binding protein [Phycisphaerae bacterium]|jgi:zinc transport system ATP-binding protein